MIYKYIDGIVIMVPIALISTYTYIYQGDSILHCLITLPYLKNRIFHYHFDDKSNTFRKT